MKDYPYIQALTHIYTYFRSVISCDFCVKTHQIKKQKQKHPPTRNLAAEYKYEDQHFKIPCKQKDLYYRTTKYVKRLCLLIYFSAAYYIGLFLSLYLHSARHAEKGPCLFAFWTSVSLAQTEVGTLPSHSLSTFLDMKISLQWFTNVVCRRSQNTTEAIFTYQLKL